MTTVPFMRTRQVRALLAVLAACVAAGCGSSAAVRVAPGPPPDLALGMPVGDAVAQLFAVGFAGTGAQAPMVARLRTRAWGVVVLDEQNTTAPEQARALARALTAAGRRGGRPAPLIAASQPDRYPGVDVLPQYQQVSGRDAHDQARRAAKILRAGGVRAAFAPVADLTYASGPATSTGFTDDAARAARLTAAAAQGWQSAGVMPVVGHFPGEGAASGDPEEAPATVGLPLSDLRRRDLVPFATAAKGAAPAVQVSDALYNAFDGVTPATLLPQSYRLLRGLGFEGVAVSGDLVAATAATGSSVGRAAVDALRAGADLVLVPGDAGNQDEAYRAVLDAVQRGRISRERLADALLHVSALKRAALQKVS
jgi:beta-N-acetylhexosaminidase